MTQVCKILRSFKNNLKNEKTEFYTWVPVGSQEYRIWGLVVGKETLFTGARSQSIYKSLPASWTWAWLGMWNQSLTALEFLNLLHSCNGRMIIIESCCGKASNVFSDILELSVKSLVIKGGENACQFQSE